MQFIYLIIFYLLTWHNKEEFYLRKNWISRHTNCTIIPNSDSCKCRCAPAAMLSCIYKYAQNARAYTRSVHIHTHAHVLPPVPYYPGSGLFHYGKSRLHFLRLSTTGVSNLENRVEGGPSNHVFLAIVSRVDPRPPPCFSSDPPFHPRASASSSLDTILFWRERRAFYSLAVGATGTRLLYLSHFLSFPRLPRSLFIFTWSPFFPLFFSFFFCAVQTALSLSGDASSIGLSRPA